NMVRAQRRLLVVVPLALGLIGALLYVALRSPRDAALVSASVPFAAVGGVLALWLRGMPLSISVAGGFITLSGVSVLNSLLLINFLRDARARGVPADAAVAEAAQTCLRTVLMTSLVAGVGFIPMATCTGMGAEVQRPL